MSVSFFEKVLVGVLVGCVILLAGMVYLTVRDERVRNETIETQCWQWANSPDARNEVAADYALCLRMKGYSR